ncbi:MAG TPA: aldo/keto reductase [Tepidisphaeraceae bacterium]|jgi:aryl-alcohol dehydrogenase-like predicted oxidoreductase|nr:aldo/keto reductase [Tepidisphaeraceae bacterium]
MKYKKLGRTEIQVSTVALGCMSLAASPTYPGIAEGEAIAVVHAAFDAGVNFFDNAPAYGDGEAESRLGKGLRGKRDKAVVATKILTEALSPEDVRRELEASLRRLGMEHVDLYQIHWPKRVVRMEETLRAMEEMVKSGKARAIGVCNFGSVDLQEALETGVRMESNQVAYSLLFRGVEFGVREMCLKEGMGVLCYSPLAQGMLAGRFGSAEEVPVERARTRHFAGTRKMARHGEAGCEVETFAAVERVKKIAERVGMPMGDLALGWLLHQPVVASVLAGASSVEQVKRNARAGEVSLSAEVVKELEEATREVKEELGGNLDPWQAAGRVR